MSLSFPTHARQRAAVAVAVRSGKVCVLCVTGCELWFSVPGVWSTMGVRVVVLCRELDDRRISHQDNPENGYITHFTSFTSPHTKKDAGPQTRSRLTARQTGGGNVNPKPNGDRVRAMRDRSVRYYSSVVTVLPARV